MSSHNYKFVSTCFTLRPYWMERIPVWLFILKFRQEINLLGASYHILNVSILPALAPILFSSNLLSLYRKGGKLWNQMILPQHNDASQLLTKLSTAHRSPFNPFNNWFIPSSSTLPSSLSSVFFVNLSLLLKLCFKQMAHQKWFSVCINRRRLTGQFYRFLIQASLAQLWWQTTTV